MKELHFQIEEKLLDKIDLHCLRKNVTRSEWIRKALSKYSEFPIGRLAQVNVKMDDRELERLKAMSKEINTSVTVGVVDLLRREINAQL